MRFSTTPMARIRLALSRSVVTAFGSAVRTNIEFDFVERQKDRHLRGIKLTNLWFEYLAEFVAQGLIDPFDVLRDIRDLAVTFAV
jgi:hypothetical protein